MPPSDGGAPMTEWACAMCPVPINEGEAHWIVQYVHSDGTVDEQRIGSMDCFTKWAAERTVHYLHHLGRD